MTATGSKPPAGRGHPPVSTRFRKGQSGNPRGRPRGSRRQAPYERVLGQMVAVRDGGQARRISAAEAFLLQLARQGLGGNASAARIAMAAIEEARAQLEIDQPQVIEISWCCIAPGSVNPALIPLRMAVKLDARRPIARIALEPWLVERALTRLAPRQLSPDQQRTVWNATRTPRKVKWPAWWEFFG